MKDQLFSNLVLHNNPYEVMDQAHTIAVITEWDEFKTYDWGNGCQSMYKPAFIFDGRNLLDREELTGLGFKVRTIGRS